MYNEANVRIHVEHPDIKSDEKDMTMSICNNLLSHN